MSVYESLCVFVCVCVGAISAAECVTLAVWLRDQLWVFYESRHGSTSPLGLFARRLRWAHAKARADCLDLYAKGKKIRSLKDRRSMQHRKDRFGGLWAPDGGEPHAVWAKSSWSGLLFISCYQMGARLGLLYVHDLDLSASPAVPLQRPDHNMWCQRSHREMCEEVKSPKSCDGSKSTIISASARSGRVTMLWRRARPGRAVAARWWDNSHLKA